LPTLSTRRPDHTSTWSLEGTASLRASRRDTDVPSRIARPKAKPRDHLVHEVWQLFIDGLAVALLAAIVMVCYYFIVDNRSDD
jgi:hypothetical protein